VSVAHDVLLIILKVLNKSLAIQTVIHTFALAKVVNDINI